MKDVSFHAASFCSAQPAQPFKMSLLLPLYIPWCYLVVCGFLEFYLGSFFGAGGGGVILEATVFLLITYTHIPIYWWEPHGLLYFSFSC